MCCVKVLMYCKKKHSIIIQTISVRTVVGDTPLWKSKCSEWATAQALLFKKIAGSFQFIGISNTNYGNRVNESKTADSRNRCEIIDEFCPVANEQKNTYV